MTDFSKMDKNKIKQFIREKRITMRELVTRSEESQNVDELKEIQKILTDLKNAIQDAEDALDALDEDGGNNDGSQEKGGGGNTGDVSRNQVPQNAQTRGGNPMAAYMQPQGGAALNAQSQSQFRSVGTFSLGGATSTTMANPLDGLALRSDESFLTRLPDSQRVHQLDLGKYIRGALIGDWTGAELERREMNTVTGGVVIPQVLAAEVLDTARNVALFGAAGCSVVPLTNGNMTIARVKKDPEFKFWAEMAEASGSNMELEGVELKAKTARGYCYVSRELLSSAQNLHGILVQAFAGAIAQMIDAAGLYGQYDSATSSFESVAPAGILNDTAITSLAASNVAYDDYIKAIGKVRRANGNPDTLCYNAAAEELMYLAKDSKGSPYPMPDVIEAINRVVSNSLKEDAVKGSDALVMDKNAVLVGMQNNILVRMTDTSDYCIKRGCVCFDVSTMLDIAVVRPSHICRITGIKAVTPAL